MQKSIFGFIFKHSLRQQIVILIQTLVSFPFLYYSLDLPKTIINQAINGKEFPKQILGFEFDQLEYLWLLSGIFLALVFVNGGFKFWNNVYKGRIGERMLRRLRYELYQRMLCFPVGFFRRTAPGELIPIITAEVEPLGGFVGDSFAVPAFQGGTLLVTLGFMIVQDPILGLAAISLYPFQLYVIPKLQRKVNNLTKQRVRLVRVLSDRISESALGSREIHANATAPYHLAEFSNQLYLNYRLRFDIYNWKFFIKFLNNFLAQLTPFFFYAIGGYLVIKGSLSFGSLVAVLGAYKDLNAPWRELLDYYQSLEDSRIKYEQIVEQFEPAGMLPTDRVIAGAAAETGGENAGGLEASNLTLVDDGGFKLVDGVTVAIDAGEHVALLGPDNSGKHELAAALAGLMGPDGGKVLLGGTDMTELPRGLVAHTIGFVGGETTLLGSTVMRNLVYGLQVRPGDVQEAMEKRRMEIREAELTGNSPHDPDADWIDYDASGVEREQFARHIIDTLERTELLTDVRELGLRQVIDPAERPDVAETVLKARQGLRGPLSDPALSAYFEPFDKEKFNSQASLAENLMFGTPVGPVFGPDRFLQNDYVRSILAETGLDKRLADAGRGAARTMVEIFRDIPAEHEFFERFSFVNAEELEEFDLMLKGEAKAREGDWTRFAALALRMIPARHRLDVVDDDLKSKILEARRRFAEEMPEELKPSIEFFDFERYNSATPVQDNMMFGRLAPGQGQLGSRMRRIIAESLDAAGLREEVLEKIIDVGLEFHVGTGGSRLAPAMRQKLAVARVLMKRPSIVVLDDPLALLENAAQTRIMASLLEAWKDRTVVWVLQRASHGRNFSRSIVLADGKIREQGTPEELEKAGTMFHELLDAE